MTYYILGEYMQVIEFPKFLMFVTPTKYFLLSPWKTFHNYKGRSEILAFAFKHSVIICNTLFTQAVGLCTKNAGLFESHFKPLKGILCMRKGNTSSRRCNNYRKSHRSWQNNSSGFNIPLSILGNISKLNSELKYNLDELD